MNKECEVIRDLLPLYADDVCSETSRGLVEEHLQECPDCSAMLEKLRSHEIETDLQEEKEQVIEYQAKRFRRRSATVGSVISSIFMIPAGVQGRKRGSPIMRRPTFSGWNASTSFSGGMAAMTARSSI